jgi:hypothetical protein
MRCPAAPKASVSSADPSRVLLAIKPTSVAL